MRKLVLLSVFFIFEITAFSEVPNEIRYNEELISYKNIPEGKVQTNFKIYDKTRRESGERLLKNRELKELSF
jgi:hypothetical protein